MSRQPKRYARVEIVPAFIHPITKGDRVVLLATTRGGPRRAAPTEQHYLRLRASNGEVLATSQMFPNRAKARRGAKAWLRAFGEVYTSHNVITRYVDDPKQPGTRVLTLALDTKSGAIREVER